MSSESLPSVITRPSLLVITGDTEGKSPCDRHYEMRGRKKSITGRKKRKCEDMQADKMLNGMSNMHFMDHSTLIKSFIRLT